MAEQALVADLRIGLTHFDADLKKAMAASDKASAGITQALNKVNNSVKGLPTEFNKLNQSLRSLEDAMNRSAHAAERQSQGWGRLKGILGSLGLLVTAQQMVQFALGAVKAAEALTSIEQQFVMLTGSQKAAKAEMAFIRAETDRLALSLLEGAKGYARLANAAKGTKLEGEATRQIFIGLNTVTRALRLSQEEYGRVLNQVTQIIAKGKIQTEELMTLAESGIPIYSMLAKSMGVSGEALSKMLEQGKVSSQALILVIGEIQKRYEELADAAANTLPAQIERGWNKILSEVTDAVQGILKSGELLRAFKFDSKALDIFPDREVVTANVDFIMRQFLAIDLIIRAVWERAGQSIVEFFETAREKLAALNEFMQNIPGVKWAQEQFKAITGSLDQVAEKTDKTKTAMGKTKDFFTAIFGGDGQAAIRIWNGLVSEGLAKFGQELPPPIDSEKMIAGQQAANAELLALQAQARKELEAEQEKARQNKHNRDVATESEAMATIASMRRRLDDEEYRDQERNRKQLIESAKEAAKTIEDMRLGLADKLREEEEKTHQDFLKILERTNKERIAQAQKPIDDLNKTIENMKENIRESMATTISDAIKGDLDNIEDAATLIKGIFADVFANMASEIIAKNVMDPLIDKFKGVIAKMQGIASGAVGGAGGGGVAPGQGFLGSNVSGGQFAAGTVGGIGAGIGVGAGVSNMAGGGKSGGALGGMAGGAMSGAMIGSMFGPWGTLIGAAAGAIVGGVMGYLAAKDPVKSSLRMQTTAGEPLSSEGPARSRSPFGVISLFEGSKATTEVASAATLAISEIDAGIAKLLDSRQREIVQNYFRSAVPEGLQVESKDVGDAISKAIQQRLYHALTALQGEDVAKNIVGELYSATSENIQAIQGRAMEALDILATIADFKAGDLSQTAQQIKAINDQFQQLMDRAVVLGLPTEDIAAEQQRQIAEITSNFNEGIGDAILGITDPVKLEFVQLERMQEERMQNAIDAGADLTAVERLNQLEREELEKRHQQNLTGIVEQSQREREEAAATANIFQAIYNITDPFKAAMLSVQQQVAAFQAQVEAGLIPQSLVDRFEEAATSQVIEQERARREEEAQMVEDFNQQISDSILGMTDAAKLELEQMDRMHQERYQQAIEMGADLTEVARLNHMERLELERQHQEELTRIQQEAQAARESAIANIFQAIYNITDPFRAAMLSIEQQVAAFQAQVEAGLIPQSLVDRYREAATNQALEQERERRQQEAQIVEDFNQQITDSIGAMTDASAQEVIEMERMHAERIQRAIELGADLAAVERLNQMEREGLEQRHQDELTAIQQNAQRQQEQATANIMQAILNIEDPFMAAMFSMQQQVAAFQSQVDAGLIPQSLVDRYRAAATNQIMQQEQERQQRAADERRRAAEQRRREAQQQAEARRREAEQRKREAEQREAQRRREAEQRKRQEEQEAERRRREAEQRKREAEQEAERRRQARLNFNSTLAGFLNPVWASMIQINEQVREFRQLTKEGILPKYAVNLFRRLALASLEIDQALQAIGGGGGSPIEQIGEAFETFIREGSPQSQAVKQMAELQEQFSGLVEAAKMLGLSTADLERSYQQQAKTIREDAIDAINKEMDAKKDQLKQIDDFFAKMRLDDVLPEKMRFDEARLQFAEAVRGGNAQEAIAASEQYLNIAQERFGSTQQFFSARSEVERLLTNLKEQQIRSIEAERQKRITQEERQLEQVHIARTSVDFLRRISTDNSATSRGIEQLIGIAKRQTTEQVETRQLLLRLVAKNKA